MNNSELKALCEKVGRMLTNRNVRVRFQQPAYVNAKGTACKRGRTAYVDILPGMTSEEFLWTFLHELGHVKTLWGSWSGTVPEYEPGELRLPELYETSPEISIIEDAAIKLAEEWFQYAEKHVDKYEDSWLVARLRALSHYLEPEIEEIMERAVERAVRRVWKV